MQRRERDVCNKAGLYMLSRQRAAPNQGVLGAIYVTADRSRQESILKEKKRKKAPGTTSPQGLQNGSHVETKTDPLIKVWSGANVFSSQ
jgi:hypothetical protein